MAQGQPLALIGELTLPSDDCREWLALAQLGVDVADYMLMGSYGVAGGDRLYLYKHKNTRGYLCVDTEGQTYLPNLSGYVPIPVQQAILGATTPPLTVWVGPRRRRLRPATVLLLVGIVAALIGPHLVRLLIHR